MQKSKWLVFGVLVAVLTMVVLPGCGKQPASQKPAGQEPGESPAPAGAAAPSRKRITIGGNNVGGVYYVYAGAISGIINSKVEGLDSTVEVCPGSSVEHVRRMNVGDLDMGPAMNDVVYKAMQGIEPFAGKQTNVRTMFPMYPGMLQGVTLAKYPIRTASDLKGRRVSPNNPGTGVYVMTKAVLEALGITFDDFKVNPLTLTEGVEAIRNGDVDVQWGAMGYPAPFIMDLSSTHDIALVGFSEAELKTLNEKYPYYVAAKIPGGTYKGISEDVMVPSVWNSFLASKDVPDDVVYNSVKAVFENLPSLVKTCESGKDTVLENAVKYAIAPLHPGAIKYFKEKGLVIPDNLVPKD